MSGRAHGGGVTREPIDHEALAEDLSALAYPLRLELLDALDTPRILSEIRLSPHKREDGLAPERLAAKQTVLAHLEKLVETGLVKPGEVQRLGKTLTTYATNPQRLYAVAEELRRLVVRHGGRGAGADATGTVIGGAPPKTRQGPRVVVVHGAYEGRAYPLGLRDGRVVVGRTSDAAISLDYDPFVSAEHSAFASHDGRWSVHDLGSKNGTSVNWEPVPRGGARTLEQGDIVGLGRSLLAFYER